MPGAAIAALSAAGPTRRRGRATGYVRPACHNAAVSAGERGMGGAGPTATRWRPGEHGVGVVSGLDPGAMFRLDDQVVIVTGVSSGLGRRFARVLDAAGATVVLAARRMERLEALASELRDAQPVACDLAHVDAPAALLDEVVHRHGRVDVLINNAGVDHTEAAIDQDVTEFRRELEVNLVAPFELARLVARSIVAQAGRGSIVNIVSIWALVGVGQIPDAGYAASKGGLVSLTRELAAQWGAPRRARERTGSRLVPLRDDRRADVRRRTLRGLDDTSHPDGSRRRGARARRRAVVPSLRRQQLRDRHGPGGRRWLDRVFEPRGVPAPPPPPRSACYSSRSS